MRALLALPLLFLAACAADGGRAPAAAAPPADGVPLGSLPKQDLAPGECGIFLWKVGEGARLLLVARANPPVARIMLDGKVVDLSRIASADAAPVTDPKARYGDGATGIALDLAIEERQGLSDGAVIPSGSLRLDRAGGASFIVPVTGLLACR